MWAEQWSYSVGGHELNDHTNYVTQIPEINNVPDYNVVSVPIDGDYPAFIRADPANGVWSILIQMQPCTWAVYETRRAQLASWLPMGVPLTLTVQIRGMTGVKSATIVPKNLIVNAKTRSLAYSCHVPIPVLA